jgi:predicted transcriptional regulator
VRSNPAAVSKYIKKRKEAKMPKKKKSAKSARKSSVKMRDLKPSKDAKGGARALRAPLRTVHHL